MIVIVSEREMKGGERARGRKRMEERERERVGECDIKSQHKM